MNKGENIAFYQTMQLGAEQLKPMIKNEGNKKIKTEFDKTIIDVIKSFNIKTEKVAWQLKLALGISSAVFIGEMLHLPKTMWLAFACMTVLSQNTTEKLNIRCEIRIKAIVLGCIIFAAAYIILPEEITSIFPILAGILVGFCATYEYKTIMNNFSALPSAIATIGFVDTLILRVVNNVFGVLYSKAFDLIYTKAMNKINYKNVNKKIENIDVA